LHQRTRHLLNKLLGRLHHRLRHGQTFDETMAFPASEEPWTTRNSLDDKLR